MGLLRKASIAIGLYVLLIHSPSVWAEEKATFIPVFPYCHPTEIARSRSSFVPVTIRLADNSQSATHSSYDWGSSKGVENICGSLGGYAYGAVIDYIAIDDQGNQKLIFDSYKSKKLPTSMIEKSHFPHDNCATGEGDIPCDLLLWEGYQVDTNNDGGLSPLNDARHVFASDPFGDNLRMITPSNANLLSFEWLPSMRVITFTVRYDTDGNGIYDTNDGEVLLHSSFPDWDLAEILVSKKIRDIHVWAKK